GGYRPGAATREVAGSVSVTAKAADAATRTAGNLRAVRALPQVATPRKVIFCPARAPVDTFARITPLTLRPFLRVPMRQTTSRSFDAQCLVPDTNSSDFGSVVRNTALPALDRKSPRLNSSHAKSSDAVSRLKNKT